VSSSRAPASDGEGLAALVRSHEGGGLLGVAAVARGADGRLQFEGAAGAAVTGLNGWRRPFTCGDPVRVASVSKLVLAAGMMTLVGDGALRLDEDVSGPLGFRLRHPAFPDDAITPSMLASHTAGLQDHASYPLPLGERTEQAFTPGAAAWEGGGWFMPLRDSPGRAFAYANVNFAVLAQVIERTSGERFDRFMSRRLFEPLGLDCGYAWSGVSQPKRDRASAVCRLHDGLWTAAADGALPAAPGVSLPLDPDRPELGVDDYRLGENGWVFSPQGGLRASARDLDTLARMFAAEGRLGATHILSEAAVRWMGEPLWTDDGDNGDPNGGMIRAYGLGVQVLTGRTGPDGDALFGPGSENWRGHHGRAYGLLSGLWWNVRDGRTLTYVINGTPGEAAAAPGRRSAWTRWEEAVVDAALGSPAGLSR
jgi:CubicO group peptidase (beta-lactamase class C family)